ncbi:MAG: DnaJ domain-containing protein [Bacteroidaceae bacterium]|nr:DnaJ domain-containing protein [Bacteroidaceae bacterium]
MLFIFSPGYCKWIGAIVGFMFRRVAGAIAGYVLGALIDDMWKHSSFRFTFGEHTRTYGGGQQTYTSPPPHTSFLQADYDELGVSPDASDDEVRAAYKRLALLYHPDRAANLGEDVRREAERKLKRINEARARIWKARGMK